MYQRKPALERAEAAFFRFYDSRIMPKPPQNERSCQKFRKGPALVQPTIGKRHGPVSEKPRPKQPG
jgi:hypothetical protein